MHHPILAGLNKLFQIVPRHSPLPGCFTRPGPGETLALPSHQLCTVSALLDTSKPATTWQVSANTVVHSKYCLVIIFLFLLLLFKAIFKALTVLLVFVSFYCCIPLRVILWHRLSLMNFQLQWFNLIQTHIGI